MRVLYFANNIVGLDVLRLLRAKGDDIVGLVVHPSERSRFRDEIIQAAGLPESRVFEGNTLRRPEIVERLGTLEAEIGLSVFFGYILRPAVISMMPRGCLNLHPAFLPYGRGAYPNVWAIVDRVPAGVTLHYIDRGVDTGDIVSRSEVPVLPTDTGETLYRRLEEACVKLFDEAWPSVRDGTAGRVPQEPDVRTSHQVADVERLDRIDLDRRYTARELIDIIRARTFPPHSGAYFEEDGHRVYLRLELLTEAEMDVPHGAREPGDDD